MTTKSRIATVIDVDEAGFERQVLEASRERPVVVDFWAPWCGPCRMLGPTLERLAEEGDGAWTLAKVNVDENPGLSMRFGVRGIPAVKAFRDGEVAAEFVGAQPEPMIRRWLEPLLPGPADERLPAARAAEEAGDAAGAAEAYRAILEEQPRHAAAALGLGRALLALDRADEAIEALESVPYEAEERDEADRLLATARFRAQAALTGGEIEARRRVSADPDDLEARIDLATALAAREEHREALEGLMAVIRRDDVATRTRARQQMLQLFQALGEDHELTREYQQQLAAALW